MKYRHYWVLSTITNVIKTEYWVIIYKSYNSDLIIFVILFANSSDDTGLMW